MGLGLMDASQISTSWMCKPIKKNCNAESKMHIVCCLLEQRLAYSYKSTSQLTHVGICIGPAPYCGAWLVPATKEWAPHRQTNWLPRSLSSSCQDKHLSILIEPHIMLTAYSPNWSQLLWSEITIIFDGPTWRLTGTNIYSTELLLRKHMQLHEKFFITSTFLISACTLR